MGQVDNVRNTPVMKIIAHHKKHLTQIIASCTVAMHLDAKTEDMVTDNTVTSIHVLKLVALLKNRVAPTIVLCTNVQIFYVLMLNIHLVYTV